MVHSWHHRRGGDSVAAWGLADRLAAAGHEVTRFAMRHPANQPSPFDVRWPAWVEPGDPADARHRLRSWSSLAWNPDAGRAAAAFYRDFRPEVVHVHHLHRHLTPSVLYAARRQGIPIVQTTHDYEWICPEGHLFSQGAPCEACRGHRYGAAVAGRCKKDSVVASAAVAAEKWVHRAVGAVDWVDRFVAPSQFLADKLVKFGVSAARIEVLPNPVEVPAPAPPGSGWLFAGRLAPEKGTRQLAQALADLPGTVVGDGPERAALRAGLPQAAFPGHLPGPGVAAAIAASAVVVVPSIWWENQPYAVTEAQAAGRAVVASAVGGIPELIDDGVDGVLVPAGDAAALRAAVRDLLADPARAASLGEAGRRRVRDRLDPGRHLARILGIYRELTHS
jgi:glycosyltransferase involved in cell wall biosynthesis